MRHLDRAVDTVMAEGAAAGALSPGSGRAPPAEAPPSLRVSQAAMSRHASGSMREHQPDLQPSTGGGAMNGRWAMRAGSLLVIVMTFAAASVGSADPKCSDAMLDGLYVLTATGWTSVSPGPPQPKAIVEIIRFDGKGSADVPGGRVSLNGAVSTTGGTGIYTTPTPVDNGCESTLTFLSGPSHYMFIPPDAKVIRTLQVNPNNVFQGTATKVSK